MNNMNREINSINSIKSKLNKKQIHMYNCYELPYFHISETVFQTYIYNKFPIKLINPRLPSMKTPKNSLFQQPSYIYPNHNKFPYNKYIKTSNSSSPNNPANSQQLNKYKLSQIKSQLIYLKIEMEELKLIIKGMNGIIDWNIAVNESINQSRDYSLIEKLKESVFLVTNQQPHKLKSTNKYQNQDYLYHREIARLNQQIAIKDTEIKMLKKEYVSDKNYLEEKIQILNRKIELIVSERADERADERVEASRLASDKEKNEERKINSMKNSMKIKRGICSHHMLLENKKVKDAGVAVRKYRAEVSPDREYNNNKQKWKQRQKQIYEVSHHKTLKTPPGRKNFKFGGNSSPSFHGSSRQLRLKSERARSLFEKKRLKNSAQSSKSIQKFQNKFQQLKSMLKESHQEFQHKRTINILKN